MKFKKFLSLLASLAMTVTAVTGAMTVSVVSAADGLATSGTWGSNGKWVLSEDGTLTVTGTGELGKNAFTPKLENVLVKSVNRLVVGEGITKIDNSFTGSEFISNHVTEMVLPSTLTGNLYNFNAGGTYVKDIYIYSRNVTGFRLSDPGSGTVFHVYKDSDTEKYLRRFYDNTDYINEEIVYIEGERPQEPEPVPAELEPLTNTSGPAGVGSKYEWNETSKTLTFSGKGAISIAEYYKKYAEETEHIVIKSGITVINSNTGIGGDSNTCGSFTGFTALKDVQLPDGITEISVCAFKNDINLEEINFPDSLNVIRESAFSGTKLKSINLREGMTIGGGAFNGCESLKEVTIPKNVRLKNMSETGGAGMQRASVTFANCTGLEKIIIEDGSLLTDAFGNEFTPNGIPDCFCLGCTSLKTVIIKGNVEHIGEWAFNSSSLTDIYLYNTGLTTITAKGSARYEFSNPTLPMDWRDSFWTGNNPTFHVVKGSTTEQTLIDAGYLTDENTVYLTDFTALDEKIKEAENLDTSKYTDDTVAALKSAIESGKTVLNNENATQDEVDKAVNAITAALSGLAKKPSQDSVKPGTTKLSIDNKITNTKSQAQKNAENAMKQAKITKLTVKSKAKKKITVTWKKVSKANGYQVQVSTNKKFKKSKIILAKTTSKKKITIKKLKSKKTYFVRVRAYATYKDSNGKPQKVYSSWIKKTRKVKVK